ncbi:hypothetical protein MKX01_031150 [Papaver californicum]|nr:hypothetical protein MKX01_031150 [Papaver californicum]
MSSVSQVQGIGSILGFECEKTEYKTSTANSIRRTLSAVDMSSRKWLSSTQSKASPSSSDELQIVADQDIVEPKNDDSQQQQQQQPGQFDIWCSILVQKPSSLPPPYVHPLVKQSKSCLSLKSLEICTENLGSESGSDGYPHSDISLSDTEEEEEEEIQEVEEEAIEQVVVEEKKKEVVLVMNYSKKSSLPPSAAPRCFPPPLKSLSKPGGGGIQMKTHRRDGRLFLEAVSLPTSQNCFNAQRQDGRLVLTFSSPVPESKSESEDIFETDEEVVDLECSHDIEIEEEEEENKGIVLEMTPKLPTGVINVHRSALMVNKFTGLTNNKNNLTTCWSSSTKLLPQSLPPISPPSLVEGAPRLIPKQQTVAVDASFNRYEYCWRKDTTTPSMVPVSGIHHLLNQQQSLPNTKKTYDHHHHNNNINNLLTGKNSYYITNKNNNFFVMDSAKGEKDYKEEKQINSNGEKVGEHLILLPPYCKPEPRRFWEPPHCIATS